MPDVPGVNFQLPDDVHRRAKSKAALRGMELYDYLRELIRRGVEEDDAADSEAGRGR